LVEIHSYKPCEVLSPFVDEYLVFEINADTDIVQNLVPSNLQNIGFTREGHMSCDSFIPPGRVTRSYVMGQITTPMTVHYSKKMSILTVQFNATGMFRLFGIPMQTFTDLGIDFETLLSPDEKTMVDDLFALTDLQKQIGCIEALLQRRVGIHTQAYAEHIIFASQHIIQKHGNVNVKQLADTLNISERSLQRHFNEQVGVMPKTFAGIVRIKKTMEMIERIPNLNWKDLSYTLDYTDQSHFIHEFKRYSGKTPTEYYRDRKDFERILYGE
jgi:AraC-like DNA-binding protein